METGALHFTARDLVSYFLAGLKLNIVLPESYLIFEALHSTTRETLILCDIDALCSAAIT